MSQLSFELIQICRQKLVEKKQDILNRVRTSKSEYYARDIGKDEMDQCTDLMAENTFLSTQEKMRTQLLEIELALARMDRGLYGICEETQEPIETERLLAMPWTKLSIEGAEIREAEERKQAR